MIDSFLRVLFEPVLFKPVPRNPNRVHFSIMNHVCAWCCRTIGTLTGQLNQRSARNFGMCPDCLQAHLDALAEPLAKSELKRARRMRKCGRSLVHIGRVLGVSRPAVEAALRAA